MTQEQPAKAFADPCSLLDLRIGDRIAASGVPAIHGPGAPRWHALTVLRQRERQAELWLHRRGVEAFHPVTWHRVVQRGQRRDYARCYLPGLVFALFPGAPVCHAVKDAPWITGALTLASGEWAVLAPRDLRGLKALALVDAQVQAARRAGQEKARRAAMVRAGDRALFRAGPLAGQPCEVVDLDAVGGARVRLGLFGGDQVALARVDDLVAVRKAG